MNSENSAKRILFYLTHPADCHRLSQVIPRLIDMGYGIKIAVSQDDLLIALCQSAGWETEIVPGGCWRRFGELNRLIKTFKPDLLVGADIAVVGAGRFRSVARLLMRERDSFWGRLCWYPLVTGVLMPALADRGYCPRKKIVYDGYSVLSYLRLRYFRPDESVINAFHPQGRYFLIRPDWYSIGEKRNQRLEIPETMMRAMVKTLSDYGTVYFISEQVLTSEWEPSRLRVSPDQFFHILSGADLVISAGQSLAAEAAVLGVPAVYVKESGSPNACLTDLENQYGLLAGFAIGHQNLWMEKIEEWLRTPNLKSHFKNKRKIMLVENQDSVELFVNAIRIVAERGRLDQQLDST